MGSECSLPRTGRRRLSTHRCLSRHSSRDCTRHHPSRRSRRRDGRSPPCNLRWTNRSRGPLRKASLARDTRPRTQPRPDSFPLSRSPAQSRIRSTRRRPSHPNTHSRQPSRHTLRPDTGPLHRKRDSLPRHTSLRHRRHRWCTDLRRHKPSRPRIQRPQRRRRIRSPQIQRLERPASPGHSRQLEPGRHHRAPHRRRPARQTPRRGGR